MFRKISYKIALQFTLFVFILFMINGAVFLVVDFRNAQRESQRRLTDMLQMVVNRPGNMGGDVPPFIRERVRIVDVHWSPVFIGGVFEDVPIIPSEGTRRIIIQGEQYGILTAPIYRNDTLAGYIQLADVERFQRADLPLRATIYLLVSVFISSLTFVMGLFFARSSLKPADRMMKQLEQFTQDASHELRTPLAIINSSLDLALKTGKHEEGIASAKEDVKQVSILIEKLLDLARLDTLTLHKENMDMSLLVQSMVEKYTTLAKERGITINTSITENVFVHGDEALIRQVIGNLLSNAIKFNKNNGTIVVTLAKKFVSIADTGIGIQTSDLPHIFDRFYQADTSRAKDGFGLGLSLVKRIVDMHGWKIRVSSSPDKGTQFTIDFSA